MPRSVRAWSIPTCDAPRVAPPARTKAVRGARERCVQVDDQLVAPSRPLPGTGQQRRTSLPGSARNRNARFGSRRSRCGAGGRTGPQEVASWAAMLPGRLAADPRIASRSGPGSPPRRRAKARERAVPARSSGARRPPGRARAGAAVPARRARAPWCSTAPPASARPTWPRCWRPSSPTPAGEAGRRLGGVDAHPPGRAGAAPAGAPAAGHRRPGPLGRRRPQPAAPRHRRHHRARRRPATACSWSTTRSSSTRRPRWRWRSSPSSRTIGVLLTVRSTESVPEPIEALWRDGDAVRIDLDVIDGDGIRALLERRSAARSTAPPSGG